MYYRGKGVPRDVAIAAESYRKATEEDVDVAAKWFLKWAEEGDAKAQCRLGTMH